MSKVAIQGNASGTGTFTIAAPNSNTDRTLTLPDEAGTVLTSASSIPAGNLTGDIIQNTGPLFRAARGPTSNQSISHNTTTKVQFDVSLIDTDSCYDNTTNYRFIPTTAGYYFLTCNIIVDPVSSSNFLSLAYIYKNGTRQILSESSIGSIGTGKNQSHSLNLIAQADGISDYFEVFFYHYDYSGSSSATIYGAGDYRNSNFQGYLLRAL